MSDTTPRRKLTQAETYKVEKVWGEEHWIVNRDYCGKKMVLNKGFRCSLHFHKDNQAEGCAMIGRLRGAQPPPGYPEEKFRQIIEGWLARGDEEGC